MYQSIEEHEAAILRYMQPANMNARRYANDRVEMACKDANVYNEATPNDVFIECIVAIIRISFNRF